MSDNPIIEVPVGMMRAWDPAQKKIILVSAPPAGPQRLTLTIRLHDEAEKNDAEKCASWATVKVDRADLSIPKADFIAKYIEPELAKLKQLTLT